jgi:hypothetical protein
MGAEIVKLREDNLYSNGRVIIFDTGEKVLIREIIDYKPKETDKFHLLKKSDELTRLAGKFYTGIIENPGKYWWVIADANNINNALDLEDFVGQEIIIPDLLSLKLEL